MDRRGIRVDPVEIDSIERMTGKDGEMKLIFRGLWEKREPMPSSSKSRASPIPKSRTRFGAPAQTMAQRALHKSILQMIMHSHFSLIDNAVAFACQAVF